MARVGSRCPRARASALAFTPVHPRTAAHNGSPALRLCSADTRGSRESPSPYAELLATAGHGKLEKSPSASRHAIDSLAPELSRYRAAESGRR